jgi:4-amino-4-deoxy-L-arabinose transferase-like glycosyltransferase
MIATSIKNRIASGKAWVDVLAIVALLLLHPVLYRLGSSNEHFPPDAVAYMAFAENFLSKGLLYFESGMAGTGKVLPPLYPFFMLAGNFFVGDFIVTSELVSSFAIIAASVAFYFIIRKFSNPYFAFLGTLGIQLNYQLNLWAITPLTEASFVLLIACSLWLTSHVITSNGARSSFALGALLALAFLTRQVGIILVPFFLLIIFVASPREFLVRSFGLAAGLFLLLAPYMITLHVQGSQIGVELSAFDPNWSKRERISIDDVDQEVQEYLRRIYATQSENYGSVWVKRRFLRQLLPDSSAMLENVDMVPAEDARDGVSGRLVNIWASLDQFDDRLLSNASHINKSIGWLVSAAFLVTLVTPALIGASRGTSLSRYLVGGFVVCYLVGISLMTGLINRYVLILAPFVLLHIFLEVVFLLRSRQITVRGIPAMHIIFAVTVAVCVLLQPTNYSDVSMNAKRSFEQIGGSNFRKFVGRGEPVLSMTPFEAYVAGGTWRILPNDSLEKIAKYAAREDIRWLVVAHRKQKDIDAYRQAKTWYLDNSLLRQYRHLLEMRAMASDGRSFLFEFKREQPP